MKSLFSGVFGALKNGLYALKSDYRDIKDYYKENGLKKTISDVKTIRSLISGNHSSSGEKTGIFGSIKNYFNSPAYSESDLKSAKNAAQKYCNVSDEENSKVLRQRIRFILELADEENVETLIAGAFGCGVFGQDPVEVAATFKDEINRLPFRNVERVVFPIPRIPGKSENFEAFRMVFMPKGNDK